jgi:HK97 gp10 family phage protein
MSAPNMTIKGLDDMIDSLDHLESRGAARAARRGINAGAQVAVKAIREAAPRDTGRLAKSIGKKVDRTKDRKSYYARIGPRKGTEAARYAHLAHNGFIAADGSYVPGTPFIEQPLETEDGRIKKAMADKLGQAIIQEAQKAAGGRR